MMRIGHGYDIHAFAPGDAVWLGGVQIEHTQSLAAHSDGDVVLHALMDALLGAAGLGDIGELFPDTDARYENAESSNLLRTVLQKIKDQGWVPVNVDITLIAEAPKISPYREAMRESVSALLALDSHCVNIKATTHEKLGALGRKEGVAAHAVVLLTESS